MVFLGLSTLAWFAQLVKFSKNGGEGVSFFSQVLISILHLIPVVYYTLPIALILACIYRYTHLVQDRERDILYSSGMTPFKLMWPAFMLALCALGGLYSLSIWGSRTAALYLRAHETATKQILPHSFITPGVFLSLGNATLYIHSKDDAGVLSGILLHEHKSKQTLVFAGKRGILRQDSEGINVTLYEGQCYTIAHSTHKTPYVMNFKRYTVHLTQKKKAEIARIKPQHLTLRELLHRISTEEPKTPWIREVYLRYLSPLWLPTLILWITWIILTQQSVRTRPYKRYILLIFGIVVAQAIQLGSIYLGGILAVFVHSVGLIPWILWGLLVFNFRRG